MVVVEDVSVVVAAVVVEEVEVPIVVGVAVV